MTNAGEGQVVVAGPSLHDLREVPSPQTRAWERAESTLPVDDALAPLLPDGIR